MSDDLAELKKQREAAWRSLVVNEQRLQAVVLKEDEDITGADLKVLRATCRFILGDIILQNRMKDGNGKYGC